MTVPASHRGFFDAAVTECGGKKIVFSVTDENHGYLPSSIDNMVGHVRHGTRICLLLSNQQMHKHKVLYTFY